jgi:RHS repeat-associated protein
VTSGRKRLSTGASINGMDFGWSFDDIGNRRTSTRDAQLAPLNPQLSTYASNSLNQYTSRTVPGAIDVLGTAAADATVLVNGQPAERQGERWYYRQTYANSTIAIWSDVTVAGVRPGAGPGGADAVATGLRHAWLPQTPEVFTHDADGNLTRDGRWNYTWDGENRLITMETRTDILPPAGEFPLSERRRLEFAYDGQGRRISKKVYTWNGSAFTLVSSLLFLYDGFNLIAEMNALNNNAPVRTYVWGLDLSGSLQGAGGVGGLLFANLGSATHAAAFDGNGNVIAYVDMATGAKSATYEYGAFGETLISDGPVAEAMPFRFSTRYTDNETGVIAFPLRPYSPLNGRFLSKDPIEEQGGLNLYGMVGNDAVDRIDPLGLLDGFAPYGFGPIGPINTSGYPSRPYVPGQSYVARADSLLEQVKRVLPSAEGSFSPISWTFLWVPYPGGAWKVEASVEGAIKKCCHSDGGTGLVAVVTVEISTTVGLGYGAGGNQGFKRDRNGRLHDSLGRFAKNPEKGFGGVEGGGAITADLVSCESTLAGSIGIEIGGRAGAVLSVNPFYSRSISFQNKINLDIDYGLRAGVSGYIGAELYLKAFAEGSGTLVIK